MVMTLIMPTIHPVFPLFAYGKDKIVFDVGANEGGYTWLFLGDGAKHVYAFEPGPKLCEKMHYRYDGNPRVTIEQVAVSDEIGELKGVTWLSAWTLGTREQTGLAYSPGARQIEGTDTIDVKTITLDSYLDNHPEITEIGLMKIDVDGYEYKVLKGAQNLINKYRPLIYIEVSVYIDRIPGSSVALFMDMVKTLNYQFLTADGRYCSYDVVLREWPWDSSCDMVLIPNERFENEFKPLLTGEIL